MLLSRLPWRRRVWAVPFLPALGWPAEPAPRRRHKTSLDWVRQMRQQGRRWRPGRRRVVVVEGGFAAAARALACVKAQVTMGSRWRWDAALDHPPGPQPPGTRGRKPLTGQRQRRLQGWAERSDTPWETVEVDWYGGQRKKLWVFSHIALWYTPSLPPVAIRYVLVADPEGQRRMEAFFCTALEATPVAILPRVVLRWSVAGTCAASRAQLGLQTQRQWSEPAMARTTPILLALVSLVTILALRWSSGGQVPVAATAWEHTTEPTFVDCLAVVRRHRWRARS